ncbi:sugar phosphate isomerase/epimerase [Breznakia sp. PF5-3]|uniref:sugar phosphate isomerase/epimerase family protein n=1 Tax=unclassified Breznakia TaxID=2623764 RepID=UPI002405A592|nr:MULTISPECIES: sugar phosphate isomerase/epimerase family protein [unclassified Breznakia]MDL2276262.1 sugar phosphate isomerase/epimerase [Breznakia sp. OttesenSCG-928-G09]MDF9824920.1 sugar phosphate isomerase/epimerase [Breznakia sp. PM6-1]MDF9835581.1 sugar phosphate isomerase/epimerase [Breznakia sp. PF5-3]MDF9838003.1 sugar phosphate isomerase/epimerase [Breznakia sp. PFB2-8]MDF9859992.1 sugar phosphate isomerase/epimerase [Breznakia sp. PH5-24]
MEIGIFSKTWNLSLEETFKEMSAYGIHHTQFNLSSAGLPTMPDEIDKAKLKEIKHLAKKYDIHLDALSGTFNMIDPDIEKRNEGIKQFDILCKIAKELQITIITLCTGSKNRESKWKWHPNNDTPEAWEDLLDTTSQILKSAETHNIILGVETEASNIVNTPLKARTYLDTFNSSNLKIVMDGANLFLPSQVENMEEVLKEAFIYLGKDIVLAHAKDLANTSDIAFVAAGEGILDYNTYIALLKKYAYDGPLIMHGLSVDQISSSIEFLEEKL